MKSDFSRGRFYIECECRSNDHILVIESHGFEDLEEPYNIDVYFSGNYKAPWYKRVWYSLEYIFNREKFCWGDSVGISEDNIHQLEQAVDYFKGKRDSKREEQILALRERMKKAGLQDYATDSDFEDAFILNTINGLVSELEERKNTEKKVQ